MKVLFKILWAFAVLPGLFLALAATSRVAKAEPYELEPVRSALLRDVFGIRVARGVTDLPADRFKGARDFAIELAMQVKARSLTVEQARDSLLKILEKMDSGTALAGLPDPEFGVVGTMPVGESVAGKAVPAYTSAIAGPLSAPQPEEAAEAPALETSSEPDSQGAATEKRHISSIGG